MSRNIIAVICLALLPFMASATTVTDWTGSTSSLWTLAANWDNGLPASGYQARIQNTFNNPVQLFSSVTVDGLTTGASSSLVLGSGAVL